MPVRNFKVRLNEMGVGSTVEIDGQVIDNVRSIEVRTAVGEMTIVRLELYAKNVEIEGKAHVFADTTGLKDAVSSCVGL